MSAVSVEAGALIDHVMGCPGCFAPSSRYCAVGLELQLSEVARFIATRNGSNERNRIYRIERDRHPERADRLGELIKARLESGVVDG